MNDEDIDLVAGIEDAWYLYQSGINTDSGRLSLVRFIEERGGQIVAVIRGLEADLAHERGNRLTSQQAAMVAWAEVERLTADVAALRAAAQAFLNVADFPSWTDGDCRFCSGGYNRQHTDACEYGIAERALTALLKIRISYA